MELKALDDSNSPQVKMMIGVLLRFWQIGLIEYDSISKQCRISIYLKQIFEAEFSELKEKIHSHLKVHSRLTKQDNSALVDIELTNKGELFQIMIKRVVDSMFRKDITIATELITNYLSAERIFSDEFALFDDLISDDELDSLILDALSDQSDLKLRGIRSDGRLAVYPTKAAD